MQQYQYDGPVMRFDDCVGKQLLLLRQSRKQKAISPIDIKKKTA